VTSALRAASVVIANTPESQRVLESASDRTVELITNCGISDEHFALLSADNKPLDNGDQRLTILFSGRLIGWKGEVLALHALAKMRRSDWRFVVLGDGPGRTHFENAVADLGLSERVELIGFEPQEKSFRHFASADVFVFPSYHDSGGTSVLEAMAAALPVVCMDAGGPGYYVTDETGIKIAPGPPESVVESLRTAIEWLGENPGARRRLGLAGRDRCRTQFRWEARERALLPLIEPLLFGGRPVPRIDALSRRQERTRLKMSPRK
jgi:glycosyltransferase involved in cell wall biosynthesis